MCQRADTKRRHDLVLITLLADQHGPQAQIPRRHPLEALPAQRGPRGCRRLGW